MLAVFGAFDFELYNACLQCKQCVVLTHTNIVTGVKSAATLANNNATSIDKLTSVTFYTKTLGIRIATVARTTTCFFILTCKEFFCLFNPFVTLNTTFEIQFAVNAFDILSCEISDLLESGNT